MPVHVGMPLYPYDHDLDNTLFIFEEMNPRVLFTAPPHSSDARMPIVRGNDVDRWHRSRRAWETSVNAYERHLRRELNFPDTYRTTRFVLSNFTYSLPLPPSDGYALNPGDARE